MTRPTPGSSRRAVLGLGLVTAVAALTTTGCTQDEAPTDLRPRGTGRRDGLGTPGSGSDDDADPDTALVALLAVDVSRAHARVRANRRAHPALARRLRPLERLHATHAAELGGLVAVPPGSARPEQRRDVVVARLATAEGLLQRDLVDGSVAAESGALALLLAGMAAGVAQERTRL